jgi:hypothetical protein
VEPLLLVPSVPVDESSGRVLFEQSEIPGKPPTVAVCYLSTYPIFGKWSIEQGDIGSYWLPASDDPSRHVMWVNAIVNECPFCKDSHAHHWPMIGLRAEYRDAPCCHDIYCVKPAVARDCIEANRLGGEECLCFYRQIFDPRRVYIRRRECVK